MSSPAHGVRPRLPTGDAFVPLAAAAALLTGSALAVLGPIGGLVPVAAVAVALAAARPRALLLLYVVAIVLLEDDDLGFLPQRGAFYDGIPSFADVVFGLLALATLAWLVQRRQPIRMPEPFTPALILLGLALAAGALVGYTARGDATSIANSLRAFAPLLVLPLLVVNLIDTKRRLVQAAGVGAALAGIKGLEGLVAWRSGAGRPLEGTTITFYEPAANFLLLVVVLGVVAAILLKVGMPLWVRLALPLAALALVLSYRRNFWIAAVLGLALVVLFSRFQVQRRLLLPMAVAVAVALAAALAWRGPPELEGPVAERVGSLSRSQITSNPYERYRLDEQKNVLAAIRENPLAGIGLGVPWQVTHPLPVELEGGRLYSHTVALWYWLKLGAAGVVAYLWLVLATLFTALAVGRKSADGILRATGLALAAATVGMAVAETTGSFTGVSDRYSILVALGFGWLASARRLALEPESRPATSTPPAGVARPRAAAGA